MEQRALPSLERFALALDSANNDPSLRELADRFARTNIFRILGTDSRERWHSAFLAWALDPSGTHGLSVALRRVLFLTTIAESCGREEEVGRVRGLMLTLRRERQPDQSTRLIWAPSARQPPNLVELARLDFGRSVTAPGPQSDYKEVSAQGPVSGNTSGRGESAAERGRFDALVAVRTHHPVGRVGASVDKPVCDVVLVVAEMKVQAAYDPDQLEGYSRWLHQSPSPELLTRGSLGLAQFATAYADILDEALGPDDGETREIEVLAVGVFIAPTDAAQRGPRAPEALAPPWTTLTYDALAEVALEPMRADPRLPGAAKIFLDEYLHLLAHSEPPLMTRTLHDYRELALQFIERNRETLLVVAQVLGESSGSPENVQASKILGVAVEEQQTEQLSSERRAVLRPGDLIEAGLLAVGDEVVHVPVKKRGSGKPFEEELRAKILGPEKSSFVLVAGPASTLELLGDSRHTATGLLKSVYQQFGAAYSASGNDGWKALRTGETLATLYDRKVQMEEE